MNDSGTIASLLRSATDILNAADIDNPRFEAQLLLGHILHCGREEFVRAPERVIEADRVADFESAVQMRAKHHPLGYITGERWFYGRLFRVTPAVLIPRPETEMLVEFALEHLADRPQLVADIGTGSGCIAVSIAAEREGVVVHVVDISPDALAVAVANRDALGVRALVIAKLGDLYEPLGDAQYDLIVSNPPYIARADTGSLMPEVRDHEPSIALWEGAGDDGLAMYRRLMNGAPAQLKAGGWIAVEVGQGQAQDVAAFAANNGLVDMEIRADFAGIDRLVAARKSL